MLIPLRRIIPTVGAVDITPIIAYLILRYILEGIVIGLVAKLVGM
jgi:uncharacterized protein YggT (Ycf19 family)